MMIFGPGFGAMELIIILVIILILFGPRKLPQIGRAIGESLRELRSSTKEKDEETSAEGSENMKAEAQSDTGKEKEKK